MYSKLIYFVTLRESIFSLLMALLDEGKTGSRLHAKAMTAYLCASLLDPDMSAKMGELDGRFRDVYQEDLQEATCELYDVVHDIMDQQYWEDTNAILKNREIHFLKLEKQE